MGDAHGSCNLVLVKVNCASIPRELFESKFFGRAKAGFTSALRDRIGRFELAGGGSLTVDEIAEIPSRLLRVFSGVRIRTHRRRTHSSCERSRKSPRQTAA